MVALHRILYKVLFHLGGQEGGRVSARGKTCILLEIKTKCGVQLADKYIYACHTCAKGFLDY